MTEEANSEDAPLADYVAKTDEEVFRIAEGIYAGSCFGTWAIRTGDEDLSGSIFMAALLGGMPPREWCDRFEIVHLYEFMDKAAQRGVNGYPCFLSHYLISAPDWRRVVEKYEKIKAAMEAAKAG